MPQEHTFRPFDTDMGKLRGGVLRMAALVERQLVRAVKAALLQAPAQAAQIIADEATVHQLHGEIDALAGLTIARQQPTAGDLQEIVAVFHLIDDLERIGQESKRIARRVQQGETFERLPDPSRMEQLADTVADVLRKAVDAFMHHDSAAAAAEQERAEALDTQLQAVLADLQHAMIQDPASVPAALAMNFVAQSVTRSLAHTRHVVQYVERAFEGRPRRDTGIS